MKPIKIIFEASLKNPDDPAEVTLVADAVGVGKTHRLATGQIVTWTAEFLRAKAHTFIGKPVNIDLDEDGEATGHSRRAIGAVTQASFDERRQVITVHAALWLHYYPSTVTRIKELEAAGRLEVSMELIPEGEMLANEDGSVTPVDGEFTGLGIVRVGADPRNKVLLVAAIQEDEANAPMKIEEILDKVKEHFQLPVPQTPEQAREERNAELSAAHEGSFEWFSRRLAEHLSSRHTPDEYIWSSVIATYPKYAIFQEGEAYYRIEFSRKGRSIEFGEPVEVDPTYNEVDASAAWSAELSASTDEDANSPHQEEVQVTDTNDELRASLRAELEAELQPKLDRLAELEAAEAERADRDAKDAIVASRTADLEKILPAKDDEARAKRGEQVRDLTDEAFEAVKAAYLEAAEVKGGIHSDADPSPERDEDADSLTDEQVSDMAGRALAAAGLAAPAKDK